MFSHKYCLLPLPPTEKSCSYDWTESLHRWSKWICTWNFVYHSYNSWFSFLPFHLWLSFYCIIARTTPRWIYNESSYKMIFKIYNSTTWIHVSHVILFSLHEFFSFFANDSDVHVLTWSSTFSNMNTCLLTKYIWLVSGASLRKKCTN